MNVDVSVQLRGVAGMGTATPPRSFVRTVKRGGRGGHESPAGVDGSVRGRDGAGGGLLPTAGLAALARDVVQAMLMELERPNRARLPAWLLAAGGIPTLTGRWSDTGRRADRRMLCVGNDPSPRFAAGAVRRGPRCGGTETGRGGVSRPFAMARLSRNTPSRSRGTCSRASSPRCTCTAPGRSSTARPARRRSRPGCRG